MNEIYDNFIFRDSHINSSDKYSTIDYLESSKSKNSLLEDDPELECSLDEKLKLMEEQIEQLKIKYIQGELFNIFPTNKQDTSFDKSQDNVPERKLKREIKIILENNDLNRVIYDLINAIGKMNKKIVIVNKTFYFSIGSIYKDEKNEKKLKKFFIKFKTKLFINGYQKQSKHDDIIIQENGQNICNNTNKGFEIMETINYIYKYFTNKAI